MADDGSAQSTFTWPKPAFVFKARLGDDVEGVFNEVSGLDPVPRPVSPFRHTLPTHGKVNVACQRGVLKGDVASLVDPGSIKRLSVVIELVDGSGTRKKWILDGAYVVHMEITDDLHISIPNAHAASSRSDGDDVAVDEIELAYDSIAVSGP